MIRMLTESVTNNLVWSELNAIPIGFVNFAAEDNPSEFPEVEPTKVETVTLEMY